MTVTTGLSGNEIFCLAEKGYAPGNIIVGNSVHSLGIVRSVGSGLKAMLGGELKQITQLIEEGRKTAYQRMLQEAVEQKATGVTGVGSQLIFHGANVEFLSIGSAVHATSSSLSKFSTSADGQELYAQLDAGYRPICFAFGNVAYAIGLGRGILGSLKTMARGEIKEYSNIFNQTRHLALSRIIENARQHDANAVVGIKTTILPFGGVNEMLMIGTASHNPALPGEKSNDPVSSDMTNIEMWNMANKGYMPLRLLLGTSVYSLGLVGGITSTLKSFVRGEINELTRLIYDARENALSIINEEAKSIGADDVVGVKTYVYQLGNGLIEFLAIGTAVKKFSAIKTESSQLIPQSIIVDKDTFYESTRSNSFNVNINKGEKGGSQSFGPIIILVVLAVLFIHILIRGFTGS
ncbi:MULTISPECIES: heavy metal-binding domain-containing protein [unclassified Legionella]|uniref:heavy metal-binding domain-containing protein n=1 Tax=unclassified Legionella TaxID=2622702 RepID=UPI0010554823|nr:MULTISPECIES: heavy metal-binding domain-containing protein [unclassified Legionella]MDI9818468.1 heavy metal-binding domain-containing protein [Legionella sp. PL877]